MSRTKGDFMEKDLILDASHTLAYEEILTYIDEPALSWWKELNTFIQQKYDVLPRITYSKCTAQKGWNVKYQKSGKSLCTLYPQKISFIALIVIKLEMAEMIEAMSTVFDPATLETIRTARPFNGTKWLMIQVDREEILKDAKELLVLKHDKTKPQKAARRKNS
jgi:hypothetical protein